VLKLCNVCCEAPGRGGFQAENEDAVLHVLHWHKLVSRIWEWRSACKKRGAGLEACTPICEERRSQFSLTPTRSRAVANSARLSRRERGEEGGRLFSASGDYSSWIPRSVALV